MVVRIAGQHLYLWRAVDSEGAVLDILVQRRRDKAAASKLMRKLLKKQDLIIRRRVRRAHHPDSRSRRRRHLPSRDIDLGSLSGLPRVVLVIEQNALGGSVEVVELAAAHCPQERREAQEPEEQGDRDEVE
jgi:hypothetical protein